MANSPLLRVSTNRRGRGFLGLDAQREAVKDRIFGVFEPISFEMKDVSRHASGNRNLARGAIMRLVVTPSSLPVPVAGPTRSAAFAASRDPAADPATVLSQPGATRSLPFLTQYLVREILPRGEVPASRWSTRDNVYRLAALNSESAPRQIVLDA
jgi:hypothetical protein